MKRMLLLCLALVTVLSLCACAQAPAETTAPTQTTQSAVTMNMQDVYAQLAKTVEMPQMLELNASLMLDYCGIQAADTAQAVVAICADSLRTDEIWLVEAVDADAAQRIAALAQSRLKKKGEESITYSPEQYAVVQKAEVLQQGNYFALIVSPDAEALAQAFRQAAGL